MKIGDLLQWEMCNLDLDQFSEENPDLKGKFENFPRSHCIAVSMAVAEMRDR